MPALDDFPRFSLAVLALLVAWYLVAVRGELRADSRQQATLWTLDGLAVAAALLHMWMFRTDADDAYITYRYARHAADGLGPVFNAGERVEGYSCFAWMAAAAAAGRLGFDIPTAGRALGMAAAVAALVATGRLSGRVMRDGIWSRLPVLVAAASGVFVAWGPSGMETSFFAFVTVVALIQAIDGRWVGAGLLAALSVMVRPDGVVLVVAVGLLALVRVSRGRARVVDVATYAAVAGAPLGVWTIWRVSYYGYLLPNAVAAKQGMALFRQIGFGERYLAGFALELLPLVVVAGLAVVAARAAGSRPEPSEARRFLTVYAAAFATFVVAVGGDWMPAFRFLAPLVPIVAILLVDAAFGSLVRIAWRPPAAAGVVCLAALMVFQQSVWHAQLMPRVRGWADQVAGLREIGRWLNRSLPQGTLIAAYANGGLPYEADNLRVIDMMGLTDEHIARRGNRLAAAGPGHIAEDNAYVASRHPAIVAFLGQGFTPGPDPFVMDAFKDAYAVVSFRFREGTNPLGQHVNLWLHRDQADQIVARLVAGGPSIEVARDFRVRGTSSEAAARPQ